MTSLLIIMFVIIFFVLWTNRDNWKSIEKEPNEGQKIEYLDWYGELKVCKYNKNIKEEIYLWRKF